MPIVNLLFGVKNKAYLISSLGTLFDYVETVTLWSTNSCGEHVPIPCTTRCYHNDMGCHSRLGVVRWIDTFLSLSLYNLSFISLSFAYIRNISNNNPMRVHLCLILFHYGENPSSKSSLWKFPWVSVHPFLTWVEKEMRRKRSNMSTIILLLIHLHTYTYSNTSLYAFPQTHIYT